MSADYLATARKYLGHAPEAVAPCPAAAPSRSELLRLAGDAAELVNAHCSSCPTCEPEAFVGEVVTFPTCAEGLALRRRYRDARRRALGGGHE